ncbi:hypothetical protein EVAR_93371_1 [Eumeta japonica]|uniref:Uncharacterized protein n=1 Tax=Eumeta variegata TaxID=151549 RepID=A0A4C2A6X7_EUMVA|nr:hypothetical protein EVAR_93371_1 [Eumeta japonica]
MLASRGDGKCKEANAARPSSARISSLQQSEPRASRAANPLGCAGGARHAPQPDGERRRVRAPRNRRRRSITLLSVSVAVRVLLVRRSNRVFNTRCRCYSAPDHMSVFDRVKTSKVSVKDATIF